MSTQEELLRDIAAKLGDLLSVYKLIHGQDIEAAKSQILAQPTRSKVYDLCDGETSVTEMARKLGVSQPSVSQHRSVLLQAGLVGVEGSPGRRFYVRRLER